MARAITSFGGRAIDSSVMACRTAQELETRGAKALALARRGAEVSVEVSGRPAPESPAAAILRGLAAATERGLCSASE